MNQQRLDKRRRVALACEACRDRKVRCDGAKPVCKRCDQRGYTVCNYSIIAGSAQRQSEQDYIASLQRQIEELQGRLGQSDSNVHFANSTADGRVQSTGTDVGEEHSQSFTTEASPDGFQPHNHMPSANMPYVSHVSTSNVSLSETIGGQVHLQTGRDFDLSDQDEGTTSVSAMGASLSLTGHSQSHPKGFYGKSSIVALLKEIHSPDMQSDRTNVSPQTPSRSQPAPSHQAKRNDQSINQTSRYLQPAYSLPPRSMADQLLTLYFQNVHIFYPWIHAPSFRHSYERLWTGTSHHPDINAETEPDIGLGGSPCSTTAFYCALNALFALGCEFSSFPAEVKDETSAIFYARMKDLLPSDILDGGSLAEIQTLLLVGQYLLCTQNATRCWNVVGLACRMALGIGLQSAPAAELSILESEMRRRIWYACIQMDMTVSMTLGRPPIIHNTHNVPLPSPIDDEYLSHHTPHAVQPATKFSTLHFCIENIKLAALLAQILEHIYHPNPNNRCDPANPLDNLSTVTKLNAALDAFAAALPRELHWDPDIKNSVNVDAVVRRQSNVLHARFLHLQILLYLPTYTHYCASARQHLTTPPSQPPQTKSLSTALTHTLSTHCAEKACQLIHAISTATATTSQQTDAATGAWWYSVYYISTSSLILTLLSSTPSLLNDFDEAEVQRAWDACAGLLARLGEEHVRARAYGRALRALRGAAEGEKVWHGIGIGDGMEGDGVLGEQGVDIFALLEDWEGGGGGGGVGSCFWG